MKMNRKLILFEVNEVPYRVLDTYCQQHPESVLNSLMSQSDQFETHTEDCLALDPWISWPTLHRGVNDEAHGILHLGQPIHEADRKFPPIWRLLKNSGLEVGVFGSLHSSQVPPDAEQYAFYLPDYFDSKAFAHPKGLLPFQELNLALTRASARNVTRAVPLSSFSVMASLLGHGIRLSTILDLAGQLLAETRDSTRRIRRRTYQSLIMGDLFLHQLERTRPAFATFYTNHVAAAMHRYWGASFPRDYAEPLEESWIRRYSNEIDFAMDKLDVVLARLKKFVDDNPGYTLMVASSMGQAAIPAQKTFDFLTILDMDRFMSSLGAPAGTWEMRPAMVPCQSVLVDAARRSDVAASLESLVIDGRRGLRDQRPVAPFSFDETEPGSFQLFIQFDSYNGERVARLNGETVSFDEIGLGLMQHEDGVNCTAQHVKSGSLFVYMPGASPRPGRTHISTADVVPSILGYFGIPAPSYLRGQSRIRLAA